MVYWYWCFNLVRSYRKWLFSNESATQYQELTWLRNLLIGSIVLVILLGLSSLAANIFHWPHAFNYLAVFYIYLTFAIYFLSFQGYAMAFSGSWPARHQPRPLSIPKFSPNIHDALLKFMKEEKLYLDPELNLGRLARLLDLPPAQVSAAINSGFGQNFRNWVNGYRVEEVKNRLSSQAFSHLSMAGIAFDCGFNSEASFYRIFRQFTGQSPKSYVESLKTRN